MTQPAAKLFTLTFRHLSTDGKKAAADLPKAQLNYISPKQLLALLKTVAQLAPAVAFPAEPEIRIAEGAGEFVVRVKGGQLHLVSWSSAHKSGPATPEEIVDTISAAESAAPRRSAAPFNQATQASASSRSFKEKLTLVALGLAILGVNAFTIWFLTRPPRSLLAKYRLLAPEQAQRVLVDVVGAYETGKGPGDRRLVIEGNASAQRIKFGVGGSVKDYQSFNVQPVESGGNMALLTSRNSLITVKDRISVVLYGDTYIRVTN